MGDRSKYVTAPHKVPVEKKTKSRGSLWCPYCGDWTLFKFDQNGYKKCPGCRISQNDFWVRSINHLDKGR